MFKYSTLFELLTYHWLLFSDPGLKVSDVSNKRCAVGDNLVYQTRRPCGGIRLLTGNQTDTATATTSQCR